MYCTDESLLGFVVQQSILEDSVSKTSAYSPSLVIIHGEIETGERINVDVSESEERYVGLFFAWEKKCYC